MRSRPAHLDTLAIAPEVVLLGTAQFRFPRPGDHPRLVEARIGLEVMDAAARRTFNSLVAEGRKVAAALLLA
jgi:uncharacterized protein